MKRLLTVLHSVLPLVLVVAVLAIVLATYRLDQEADRRHRSVVLVLNHLSDRLSDAESELANVEIESELILDRLESEGHELRSEIDSLRDCVNELVLDLLARFTRFLQVCT